MKKWKGSIIWIVGFWGGGLSAVLLQQDNILLYCVVTVVSSVLAQVVYLGWKK